MDIIVTTPKSQMAAAAQEAADARCAGAGTEYFRSFPRAYAPGQLRPGDRIYYVEDGFVRGFAVVSHIEQSQFPMQCQTTGREWPAGYYAFMQADSWRWIRPIPMRGFQGFRYANGGLTRSEYDGTRESDDSPAHIVVDGVWHPVLEEGDWLFQRPRSCRVCGCTDNYGCPPPAGPCWWVEHDLCSVCQERGLGSRRPAAPSEVKNGSAKRRKADGSEMPDP